MTDASNGGGSRLSSAELARIDAWWRAANYLSVGQIYLLDNPLLREPLRPEHIKPRLLGHWGTTPGLNFLYAHFSQAVKERDLDAIWIVGPGHGGPAAVANAWLEGTTSELYPDLSRDEEGMRRLFRQFSFPGGIGSHVTPETPGSIHEGGELGYALVHAFGAAFDNPDLKVLCVIGDGEAETGPLAASWHSNKFLNPARDGAVLPILHLNGYKIANPTVLARIPEAELVELLRGYGWRPVIVAGSEPAEMHQAMAAALDDVLDDIDRIQRAARSGGDPSRPRWPMIVLRTPKGWTGPKVVDGVKIEGTFRAHQVPLAEVRTKPDHLALLVAWMESYRPAELFDGAGAPRPELLDFPPAGARRISANPHANGGLLLRDLSLPDFRTYGVDVPRPATTSSEATRVLGTFLRDVIVHNPDHFRIFGPDETMSNRLNAVFDVTDRQWLAETIPGDDHLAPEGRVMEVLSEHLCEGWLEGYLLTGRHGLFNCYEAFTHIVDSMFNQHAKWLKTTREIPWRRPIASLNYLLTSHVWRQDQNGFSHQDPGFIDHVVNKKAEVIRVYLPPDTNCLLSVADHCLRSRNYVNVIVAGKQPALNYLTMDEAVLHCTRGIGVWDWASNDGDEPDVVMACCGDVPTLETLAAVEILRRELPDLRVRVVNVVDLMRLEPSTEHPHGLSDQEFDTIFTTDRPVIFAYHGYPWLIHRLAYRRTNHDNFHVRGYKEEGTVTTPFDMAMRNDLDRFHLVMDVIDRVPTLGSTAARLRQEMVDDRVTARAYAQRTGEDPAGDQRVGLVGREHAGLTTLVLNAGSSTLKASLVERGADRPATFASEPWVGGQGNVDAGTTLEQLLGRLDLDRVTVGGIGHRVVHGGTVFDRPAIIDERVIAEIDALSPLAPLHNPIAVATIRAARRRFPAVRQVACFDTAFHARLPATARRDPLPDDWSAWGIRRYGFHGLSVEWSMDRAARLLHRPVRELRLVVAHLGAGCSATAVDRGRSAWTSMGFTPLDGMMMATRAGSIDPGILVQILRHRRLDLDDLEAALEHGSGLLGVGGTPDMAALLERETAGDPAARLAIAMFVDRAAAAIAGAMTRLPAVDAIVLTGGIGEHAGSIRARICRRLRVVGVPPVAARSIARDAVIGGRGGPLAVLRIEAREDIVISQVVEGLA